MADTLETTAETPPEVIYNSQPIQKLAIGSYRFERGVLRLSPAEAEKFDAILAAMPLIERNRVTKIDLAKANQIISAIVPAATQNSDSSAGRAALIKLQKEQPNVGTKPVDTPPASESAPAT
jgi:hypothetical protein